MSSIYSCLYLINDLLLIINDRPYDGIHICTRACGIPIHTPSQRQKNTHTNIKTRFPETLVSRIDHAAGEANGFCSGLVGKSIKLASVLVAFRKMVEQVRRGEDSGGVQCLNFFRRDSEQGGEFVLPGDHGRENQISGGKLQPKIRS